LLNQIRDAVETTSAENVETAKQIREEVETKLRESEDDFTRLSHGVDVLIYQIEPIIELITFAGFNQNLCGTGKLTKQSIFEKISKMLLKIIF